MEKFMKAWLLPALTGIPSLKFAEAPDPVPDPGQIVLQLHFAALNPADAYLAVGQYPAQPPFPHILGRDGIGTVVRIATAPPQISQKYSNKPHSPGIIPQNNDQIPSNNDQITTITEPKINLGDLRAILRSAVGVTRPGTLAQFVAVDPASTVPVPTGWSPEQAAAAPLVYVTAWQALTQWGDLPANSVILITGASGGVGTAAIQLAHALGHRVIALSRGTSKVQQLQALGADFVYDSAIPTWRDQLQTALGKNPVNLALDNIGGENFPRLIDVMSYAGCISVVGRLAGPVPNFNTASLFFRRLKIGGVAVGTYTNLDAHSAWNNVLTTLARTTAKPLIDHIFDFSQVPQAFARLAAGPMGKVLVRINACP
jgi:NADPH:quinone reductase